MLAGSSHLVRHPMARHLKDGRSCGQLAQLTPRHGVGARPDEAAAGVVGRGRLLDPHAVLPVPLVLVGPGQRRGGRGGRCRVGGAHAAAADALVVGGAAAAVLGLETVSLGETRVLPATEEEDDGGGGDGDEGDAEAETYAEAHFGVRGEACGGGGRGGGAVPAGA